MTEPEYINREALMKSIGESTEPFTTSMVYRFIRNAPAVDVAPRAEIAEEIFNGLIKVFMAKQRHYENIRRPGKANQMIEAREEIYKFKREYDERRADNG